MSPVKSKKASATKTATTSKSTVTKTKKTTPAKSGAVATTVIQAKTVKKALTKTQVVQPTLEKKGFRAASSVKPQPALTKDDLNKRQKSKGTSRKQGGVVYKALKPKEFKAMAQVQECGPTDVA